MIWQGSWLYYVIICDASLHGIGAVFSHVIGNGEKHDRSTKWSCRCPSPFTGEQIKLWTDKDPVLARVKEQY